MTTEERFSKGMEVRTRLNGGTPPGPRPPYYYLAKGMDEWITAAFYGDIWGRPGLDVKTRSVATVSALAVLEREPQLRTHLNIALNNGWTKEELSEILFHLTPYGGLPVSLNALRVAQEVFDQRGL